MVNLGDAVNVEGFASAIGDVQNTWMMICFTGVLALFFGFFFLELMKWFAGIVVWIFIWAFLGCECLMALFFYLRATKLIEENEEANK